MCIQISVYIPSIETPPDASVYHNLYKCNLRNDQWILRYTFELTNKYDQKLIMITPLK